MTKLFERLKSDTKKFSMKSSISDKIAKHQGYKLAKHQGYSNSKWEKNPTYGG